MRNIRQVIVENEKRLKALDVVYNPHTGEGSFIPRQEIYYKAANGKEAHLWLPKTMLEIPAIELLHKTKSIEQTLKETIGPSVNEDIMKGFESQLMNLRFDHDFEFWAIVAVKIKPKTKDVEKSKQTEIPFELNRPQREILLVELERMRIAGIPIRIVLLKARQWGGSTLVQMYISWLQCRLFKGLNSVIVTDVEDQARTIRSMYTRMIKHYPKELGEIKWSNFEGSTKNKYWAERDTVISIGSAQQPDSLRSGDIRALHASEVGLMKATEGKSPEDLIQGIEGTLPLIGESISVLESTAKGVGNYFHSAWLKAMREESNYKPVFVPWYKIENYSEPFKDDKRFSFIQNKMKDEDSYFWELWDMGATLESIHWYWSKSRDMNDEWRMKSEYPSTAGEAFQSTGHRVFPPGYVVKARKHNLNPIAKGELFADANKGKDAFKNIRFEKVNEGKLKIWEFPDKVTKISDRYVVSLDNGGASKTADPSVISVIDRFGLMAHLEEPEYVEVVAQWKGIIDSDLLAWKAVQIAKWYNDALFVPEANRQIEADDNAEGDNSYTILNEISEDYDNLFCRTTPDKIKLGVPAMYGAWTDRKTKPMYINCLRALMRDGTLIERSEEACAEYDLYEHKTGGKMGNVQGKDSHDDIVMSRAIGVWVATKYPYLEYPKLIVKTERKSYSTRIVGEATI